MSKYKSCSLQELQNLHVSYIQNIIHITPCICICSTPTINYEKHGKKITSQVTTLLNVRKSPGLGFTKILK